MAIIDYKFYTPSYENSAKDLENIKTNGEVIDEVFKTSNVKKIVEECWDRDGKKIVADIIQRNKANPKIDHRGLYFHTDLRFIGLVRVPLDGAVEKYKEYIHLFYSSDIKEIYTDLAKPLMEAYRKYYSKPIDYTWSDVPDGLTEDQQYFFHAFSYALNSVLPFHLYDVLLHKDGIGEVVEYLARMISDLNGNNTELSSELIKKINGLILQNNSNPDTIKNFKEVLGINDLIKKIDTLNKNTYNENTSIEEKVRSYSTLDFDINKPTNFFTFIFSKILNTQNPILKGVITASPEFILKQINTPVFNYPIEIPSSFNGTNLQYQNTIGIYEASLENFETATDRFNNLKQKLITDFNLTPITQNLYGRYVLQLENLEDYNTFINHPLRNKMSLDEFINTIPLSKKPPRSIEETIKNNLLEDYSFYINFTYYDFISKKVFKNKFKITYHIKSLNDVLNQNFQVVKHTNFAPQLENYNDRVFYRQDKNSYRIMYHLLNTSVAKDNYYYFAILPNLEETLKEANVEDWS